MKNIATREHMGDNPNNMRYFTNKNFETEDDGC